MTTVKADFRVLSVTPRESGGASVLAECVDADVDHTFGVQPTENGKKFLAALSVGKVFTSTLSVEES